MSSTYGRISAIDPGIGGSNIARMEKPLRDYLGTLDLPDGSIRLTDDLNEARRSYCPGRGRWPVFSYRQARLTHSWFILDPDHIPLLRAERQLRTLLVGPGRAAKSVRLATEVALGLVSTTRMKDACPRALAAREAAIAAAEAGVMAWWPSNGHLVVVPRPAMSLEAGVLHRWDGGAAVRWPSGRELHFWRGVRVADSVGRNPDRITAGVIAATTNAERRRVMIDRMGYERYLHEANAELRSQDDFGRLWVAAGRYALDPDEPLTMVEVVNATAEPDGKYRRYFLHVPPDTRTAREAVAWTFGFDTADDYLLAVET